jgi:hypothetical protein
LQRLVEPHQLGAQKNSFARDVVLDPRHPPGRTPRGGMYG